ncbi:MAG: hypothetical protein J0L64_01095 [Acidobacteria bacterium]|nr:hypothetical protein [Acidobacteriota bacterium]
MSEVIATDQSLREIMDPLPGSAETGTNRADRYLWAPPGKEISVQLDLDVVERLLADVLRGFGMIPKRGVEVGGVLLGEFVDAQTVRVTDYETVPCQHSRGSSYLMSGEETERLRAVCDRWLATPGGRTTVVGLFRSHTREGFHVTVEDADLLDRMAPDPQAVMLLVKPYATRVSVGGFFFREEGGIRRMDSPYLEFPFRRRELAGEEQEAVSATAESTPAAAAQTGQRTAPPSFSFGGYNQGEKSAMSESITAEQGYSFSGEAAEETGQKKRKRSGWVWIPLSFIFLLLGVVLGFQVALSVGSKLPSGLRPPDPFTMNLQANQSGTSVHVRWDRSAPAIQNAPRGVLHIQDGAAEQRVDLDSLQLLNGSVIYRRAAENVKFRLEVFTSGKSSLSETVEFKAH